MKNEDLHDQLLSKMEDHYLLDGIPKEKEFIRDGPSHWDKYQEKSKPRIVFLAKESHSSFHPSTPSKVNNPFSRNVARWANLIMAAEDTNSNIKNLYSDELQEAWDSIAIVEIKKIDDDKTDSPDSDIKKFAWIGRDFLKQQLELLDPHIIVCCATLESYDIINNYSEQEKKLHEKLIYNQEGIRAWTIWNAWDQKDVIVLDFCHPSKRISGEEMFRLMKNFISDPVVQAEYLKIRKSK
jgi:hypothetical protein